MRRCALECQQKSPMLTEKRREALSSMYSLVGTHSAVKLCRWQKSMLRCRGGCYKWTMYGVASHRCMEATPNLSCANKCVFCWRLNSNPSAKSFRWSVDPPEEIVEKMIQSHCDLVKNVSGMPGVHPERLEEAMQPRHCALSLVGEPILYPQVNTFLRLLHSRRISTFLVTNGQFPDEIPALAGVTQLYLSIDAPNSTTMKILDRPIFADYWDRFEQSVKFMRERRERTVFRLTLIEGFNMSRSDISEYARIVCDGHPDFIEMKRLTPAFQSHASNVLRMKNVPTWESVVEFSKALCDRLDSRYQVCCVHEHSGCILLGQNKFIVNGNIHTWIDFDKFHSLVSRNAEASTLTPPLPEEYLLPTPEWALPHSLSQGFDPAQQRHITKKRAKHLEREAQSNNADP